MADIIKLNRKLNIVLPPFVIENGQAHVYSSPISLVVFLNCKSESSFSWRKLAH